MSPTVSVVVPTYNRLQLLPQTVRSILDQTFGDLELIVVDDGSTDGTAAYLAGIDDPRVRSIGLPHSGNIAAIRNAGAARATGSFLCFLDSDDLWRPPKLATQLATMAEEHTAWSYTRFEHCDDTGAIVPAVAGEWSAVSGDIVLPLIRATAPVALATIAVERSLFNTVGGFDESATIRLREDYHFMVRLALAARTVAVDEPLVVIRDHDRRSTRALDPAEALLLTARVYESLLQTVLSEGRHTRAARRRRAVSLAGAGRRYLRTASLRQAAACLVRAAMAALGSIPLEAARRRR